MNFKYKEYWKVFEKLYSDELCMKYLAVLLVICFINLIFR